ncbi:AcrR family transcriptional regulator [Streptomyces achromogenes]|uniref:AcrR family transcriptional regulator n=1 Tax=Streptomyces achromogenes TaxID=67255 RepID=A0ABU0Q8L2_STRAH|nr:TetR/AcrR family transcriptional regulator [Streptomyces achromogenes]MDQ0687010.1 AcrR family transcriptional regulator [Streptomyces achromogenes]MDQ0834164.1 AcrR family transcriptional regulator [Streptomyces achromogenes]
MPRVGLTTDRLVEAAAELADEVGFDHVSISALARRFGVRDASLYSHVRNLGELRTRLALFVGGEMIDEIGSAVVGLAGKDALVAFAGAYREYALRHPGRYAATQTRIDRERDRELTADSPALRRTAEITYGMLRGYGLEEPDLTDAVRLLRSTFHGYCMLEAGGGFGAPRDVRKSWDKAIDALHAALTHWPRETADRRG